VEASPFYLGRLLEEIYMKVIRCRDVGVDCDFEARGQTEQEVLKECTEHARSAHGMEEIPAELVMKVKAAIRDEKAA
jgi:predicted small metal-binding protein